WLAFALAILFGALIAAVMGFLIGIPVMRLRGDYLAIVTLGFGEIMKSLFNNIYLTYDKSGLHFGFTAAPKNIDAETQIEILRGPKGTSAPSLTNFWVVAAVLLVCLLILMMFMDSKSGRACMAVRDNYIAAQSVGISVTKFRLMAFTLSAAIAGVAGALYMHSLDNMLPKKFDYNLSILILVYVVLGGLGSLRGSIIATIVLYALPELLRNINQEIVNYRMLFYAIILICLMLWNNAPFFIALREKIKTKFKKKDQAADITSGGAEV
ncbi:MAG: branched-chain amino acid ABC transporter permease, partial [Oscillospiraceae bacterium]|nr:branched-chain amino acid ABC transporter permease [Oscillospiraceae bacterium]